MSLDFAKALKAPLSAENWFVKMLIGGVLLCVPIANFIVLGYFVKYLKNVINNECSLPEFKDMGALFATGLKMFVGAIVLAVPILIVTFIVSMIFAKAQMMAVIINYILQIAYGFVGVLMVANFSLDEKILSMIDFKRAFLLVQGNNLGSYVLNIILMNLLFLVITVVCCITVVGIVLVPFIMYSVALSVYNLTGQFAKDAPKLQEAIAAASV